MRERVLRRLSRIHALLHSAEDEHVVVHREAEEDHEQKERQPRGDREVAREAEDALSPGVLENGDEDPVSGPDREQVQHHGLERDDDRPERHEHQDECKAQDEQEDNGHPGLHLLVEVERRGGGAGDRPLRIRHRLRDRRDDVVAKSRERLVRRLVVTLAGDRELDAGHRLVRVHEDVKRREELAGAQRAAAEVVVRLPVDRCRHIAALDDELDRGLRAGERRLHILVGLHDRQVFRQVGETRHLRVQRERRSREHEEKPRRKNDRDDGPPQHGAHDRAPEAILAVNPVQVRHASQVPDHPTRGPAAPSLHDPPGGPDVLHHRPIRLHRPCAGSIVQQSGRHSLGGTQSATTMQAPII